MRISASWYGSLWPTEYKDVARIVPTRGLPSNRHPDTPKCAIVLGAVKDETLRWR